MTIFPSKHMIMVMLLSSVKSLGLFSAVLARKLYFWEDQKSLQQKIVSFIPSLTQLIILLSFHTSFVNFALSLLKFNLPSVLVSFLVLSSFFSVVKFHSCQWQYDDDGCKHSTGCADKWPGSPISRMLTHMLNPPTVAHKPPDQQHCNGFGEEI